MAAEAFRATTLQAMGDEWIRTLPEIPPAKGEVEGLVRRRMETDGQTVFRQLAQLGCASAKLIVDLRMTRGVSKNALYGLQHDRAAQITLALILSATRYRVHYGGRVLNTVCGGPTLSCICWSAMGRWSSYSGACRRRRFW